MLVSPSFGTSFGKPDFVSVFARAIVNGLGVILVHGNTAFGQKIKPRWNVRGAVPALKSQTPRGQRATPIKVPAFFSPSHRRCTTAFCLH
jgi:hypothetical protein